VAVIVGTGHHFAEEDGAEGNFANEQKVAGLVGTE